MEAHRQKTHTKVLYLAILKYGDSNFIHELIETCDESIINDREKFWIKYFNSNDRTTGYNRTIGGDGGDTYSGLTDEQKMICDNKKSEHGKRLIKDPVYMEKLRTATKELWKNEQYRNNIITNLKITMSTPECKERMSKASKEFGNRPEIKLIRSENSKGIKNSRWLGYVRVTDLDGTVQIFDTTKIAANTLKISGDEISKHCTNGTTFKIGIYKGWKFERFKELPGGSCEITRV